MRNVSPFLYLMIQPHHHHHLYILQPPSSTTTTNYPQLYRHALHCFIYMDNLLCNEVWLMSPKYDELIHDDNINAQAEIDKHDFPAKEDCDEAHPVFLSKEAKHMPELGYSKFVKNNHTIRNARFKAVNWLIKSRKRMNLLPGTVFLAVNYLDRFISLTLCRDWNCWMFELLSVACLSIASKFNETTTWLLQEFQVDGVDNCFAPTLIQRMELTVLKALAWRMNSTTPFSYVHVLTCTIDALNETVVEDITKRVTELLIAALLDTGFLEFGQCVVASSAVRCVFEYLFPSSNNFSLPHLDEHVPQDQKDDLVRCQRAMGKLLVQENEKMLVASRRNYCNGPSSPVTVLKVGSFKLYECPVHSRSGRKRKWEELA